MADNEKYVRAEEFEAAVPSGVLSGDPVALGQIPAYALTDRNAAGRASVKTVGAITTPVEGETNGAAGSAVAFGDILYYNAAATPKLNKDTTGVRWGYAMGTVGSGAIATIDVKVGY